MLGKCGIMYEFRKVKNIRPLPPSSFIHVGRAVDTAANVNLKTKIDTETLLPTEQVLDIARDTTRHWFSVDGVTLTPDDPPSEKAAADKAVDKAVRLAKLHSEELAPTLRPQHVQRSWTMEIVGCSFDLVGTRDLDEVDGSVHDLKTKKKSPTAREAELSDQGTLYTLSRMVIDGVKPPVRFVLDSMVDLKSGPKVVIQESTRSEADFRVLANRLEAAERVINSGAFTPARQTDWWCSLTYCGYATICPYFRRPVSVAVGEIAE